MFALAIESSHQKGMGHLFRVLNFIDFLASNSESYIVLVNNDRTACNLLTSRGIRFETVNFTDHESDWESNLILRYGIDVWVNDMLDTDIKYARNIKKNDIKLVTFDDRGSGAEIADIHVAALAFAQDGKPKGKKVLAGLDYLILNKDIAIYQRVRKNINNIIVTLGGSDTYGVTLKVVNLLKSLGKKATIHIGPSFNHLKELNDLFDNNFSIINNIPSLIKEFYRYDIAITGGGMTPFEANASGLPCIIIANELFEIANGRLLNEIGSSKFAGYYKEINSDYFKMDFNIKNMSIAGINAIKSNGTEKIYKYIKAL